MLAPTDRSLASWYAYAQSQLTEEDARILSASAFDVEFSELVANNDVGRISDASIKRLKCFVKRRVRGEPVAYILGSRGFWRHDFTVTPATLIPRPETETLVETVLPFLGEDSRVLDLGTGSGAIGLSVAEERGADVVLADASAEALAIARLNAERLGLNAKFVKSDWYQNIEGRFNYIVSNPPYVASNDEHLQQGDLVFEPNLALDGGPDGLAALREVIRHAPSHLASCGRLAVEHGYDQGSAVRCLFEQAGFQCVQTTRDLGNLERVTHGVTQ
ncbi:MAG: peptide chain release factor N(5)-glutamine methyltransferase [Gammaproteobacteria bacterium]|nr:peptide chain release factor N(5)-glutamine methyltransferase [Gammaproteobacteria bacterium]